MKNRSIIGILGGLGLSGILTLVNGVGLAITIMLGLITVFMGYKIWTLLK
jgi:hypothetical protein